MLRRGPGQALLAHPAARDDVMKSQKAVTPQLRMICCLPVSQNDSSVYSDTYTVLKYGASGNNKSSCLSFLNAKTKL